MSNEIYAYVQYIDSQSQWIYKCDESFKAGDVVEAPVFNGDYFNVAIIKRIEKISEQELPISKEKILTITKKLNKKEYEKIFHPLEFMKKYIRKDYLKEWKFADENDWVKVYQTSYGGQISYEQDGVLTCLLNDCVNDDYFQKYTITSHKHFDIKLMYVQTILSSLYHKIITEQEFIELLNVV